MVPQPESGGGAKGDKGAAAAERGIHPGGAIPRGSVGMSALQQCRRHAWFVTMVSLAFVAVFLGVPPMAAHADAALTIDDFSGSVYGTRTVTPLPLPDTSTTAPGTFTQTGGEGILTFGGNGNAVGGVQLDYAFSGALDLRAGSNNAQLFFETTSIQRTGGQVGDTATILTAQVTDSGGTVGTYSTSISSATAQNLVLNFDCTTNPVCFTPQINFARVTHLRVTFAFPSNYSGSSSTTVHLSSIRTTPLGGVIPDPATPLISIPAPVVAPAGATISFPFTFTSGGQPVSVTGLTAAGVTGSGTAAGATFVSVSGSGSSYTATVGPLTSSGSVVVSIAAGAATDTWSQPTRAASAQTTFTIPIPPTMSDQSFVYVRGISDTKTLAATGTPYPSFAVVTGALPDGLTLSPTGAISGTPTRSGTTQVTVRATNAGGSVDAVVTIVVAVPPAGPVQDLLFDVGVASSQTVVLADSGYPTATLSLSGSLPAGLTASTQPGDIVISGTPAAPGGATTVDVIATNAAGTITLPVQIIVSQPPAITAPGSLNLALGMPVSQAVSAAGYPTPTWAATSLPAGLTLTDLGGGQARIEGSPTTVGSSTATLTATNGSGTDQTSVTITVGTAPSLDVPVAVVAEVGTAVTVPVTVGGWPAPVVTADGLPGGLSLEQDGAGVRITGTPTATGVYTVTTTASNVFGSAPGVTTITVGVSPAILAPDTLTLLLGDPVVHLVFAQGDPAPTWSATSLPAGLSLRDLGASIAAIEGTPTAPGVSTATLTATNAIGTAQKTVEITVGTAPSVTVAASVLAEIGETVTVQVGVGGSPVPLVTTTGLPDGLVLEQDGAGVRITGTPTTAGAYTVTTTATNAFGSVGAMTTITVGEPPTIDASDGRIPGGVGGALAVSAAGFPVPTLDGILPDGFSLVDNADGTGTLVVDPSVPTGVYPVTLSTRNAFGTDAVTISVQVYGPPAFTSPAQARFTQGRDGSFTITTTGWPTPTLAIHGDLPDGLTYTDLGDGTATLTGAPTTVGTSTVTLTATLPGLEVPPFMPFSLLVATDPTVATQDLTIIVSAVEASPTPPSVSPSAPPTVIPTVVSSSAGPVASLPSTGGTSALPVVVGGLLVGAGALLLAGRRRHSHR